MGAARRTGHRTSPPPLPLTGEVVAGRVRSRRPEEDERYLADLLRRLVPGGDRESEMEVLFRTYGHPHSHSLEARRHPGLGRAGISYSCTKLSWVLVGALELH